jgi:apolipoprotein N-acyltransferase
MVLMEFIHGSGFMTVLFVIYIALLFSTKAWLAQSAYWLEILVRFRVWGDLSLLWSDQTTQFPITVEPLITDTLINEHLQ